MANYGSTVRTNYFRVTNEETYKMLFSRLCSNSTVDDLTKERDGILYHGFGAYDSIDYCISEDNYDFDAFLKELQKILPEDEAFIYFESGCEKLCYVTGEVIVVTSKQIVSETLENWAMTEAKKLLGEDFITRTTF